MFHPTQPGRSIYLWIALLICTYQYPLKLTLQTSQLVNPGPHGLEPAPVYTTEAELQSPEIFCTYYLHSSSASSAPRRSSETISRRHPLTSLRCLSLDSLTTFAGDIILQCGHLTSLYVYPIIDCMPHHVHRWY